MGILNNYMSSPQTAQSFDVYISGRQPVCLSDIPKTYSYQITYNNRKLWFKVIGPSRNSDRSLKQGFTYSAI